MAMLSQLTVEVESKLKSLFRALRPFEDLLCPVHPEEPVHLALVDQLDLEFQRQSLASPRQATTTLGYNQFLSNKHLMTYYVSNFAKVPQLEPC